MTDQVKTIELIEDFLVGSGAADLRELESITDVFCPFEAIGMVSQEIRHSNFLSYILDENKPHVFGSKILEELLSLIAERTNDADIEFSKLDLHFMDISNATISREWRNIDLLIEVPRKLSHHSKGLLIAVELKIHATESRTQLKEYKKIVDDEFPSEKWDKIFVFLTLHEDDPSEENSDTWTPVGLPELIKRLERFIQINAFQGGSAMLLDSYIKMMRRNFMPDTELENIARKIWTKHKLALDALYDYYPDMKGEVMELLYDNRDEFAKYLSEQTKCRIVAENSDYNHIRFGLAEWDDHPGMSSGDNTWLDTDRLMALEITGWSGHKIRLSYVVGPGDEVVREAIFDKVLEQIDRRKISIGKRTPISNTRHKHLSANFVLSDKRYEKAEENEETALDLYEDVKKNSVKFLRETLPIYKKIIKRSMQ
jgi:hypothetical protein